VEALDAHDEVERFVGEREELRRDDVGDAIGIPRDVEADDVRR
jgi:hypothetical protein